MESDSVIDTLKTSEIKYSLKIHDTIRTLQNENGLRHQDYMRYRHYLNNKLRRIRKAVGFTFGKGKVFVKREITASVVNSDTYLLILLLSAEREWSHAIELKDSYVKVNKQKILHSKVGKFRKAAEWARLLESICTEVSDNQTILEASAYSSWMTGQSLLERELWSEAVLSLSKAKGIYDELSKIGTLDQQDLFTQRSVELDPVLRFCRYSSGLAEMDIEDAFASNPELQAKLEEMKLKSVSATSTSADSQISLGFSWNNKKVNCSTDAIFLLCTKLKTALDTLFATNVIQQPEAVEKAGNGLEKSRDSLYMKVLSIISDIQGKVNDTLGTLTEGAGGRLGDTKEELGHLKAFLQYKRLEVLLTRSQELVRTIEAGEKEVEKRPYELAHLYDQQLTSVREMLTVPGCDEDDLLCMRLAVQEQIARAARALYSSDCYAYEHKWSEAVVSLELAENVVSTAYSRLQDLEEAGGKDVDADDLSQLKESLSKLDKRTTGSKCRLPALHFLWANQETSLKTDATKSTEHPYRLTGSLLTRKNDWVTVPPTSTAEGINVKEGRGKAGKVKGGTDKNSFGQPTVFDIPPAFAPIPCKPIFFDVAYNSIEFPDIDSRAGLAVPDKKPAPATGLVGAAQSLFGWFRT